MTNSNVPANITLNETSNSLNVCSSLNAVNNESKNDSNKKSSEENLIGFIIDNNLNKIISQNSSRSSSAETFYKYTNNYDIHTTIIEDLILDEIRDVDNDTILYPIQNTNTSNYKSNSFEEESKQRMSASNLSSKNSLQKSYLKQYLEKISRKHINYNSNVVDSEYYSNTSRDSIATIMSSTNQDVLANNSQYKFFSYNPKPRPMWRL